MSYLDKIAGISGVYCITNTLNGKQYVGQSADIGRRWRVHLNSSTLEVQKDIRTLGRENFDFKILEEVKNPEERCEREKYWIEKLGTFENGYNSTKGGEKGWLGLHHTEEQRKKMSKALRGRSFSEEHKEKCAELNRRKAQDPEFRKKLSESKRGWHHREESRKKMSESRRGIPKTRYRYLLPDGTIKEMTPQSASQWYTKRGIEITKLD